MAHAASPLVALAARPLRVLFLCTGNSLPEPDGGSWARALLGGRVDPFSAGTEPHALDRLAVRADGRGGVDISHHAPKGLDALAGRRSTAS
jgi:protein-tyrosine-phosphatase